MLERHHARTSRDRAKEEGRELRCHCGKGVDIYHSRSLKHVESRGGIFGASGCRGCSTLEEQVAKVGLKEPHPGVGIAAEAQLLGRPSAAAQERRRNLDANGRCAKVSGGGQRQSAITTAEINEDIIGGHTESTKSKRDTRVCGLDVWYYPALAVAQCRSFVLLVGMRHTLDGSLRPRHRSCWVRRASLIGPA